MSSSNVFHVFDFSGLMTGAVTENLGPVKGSDKVLDFKSRKEFWKAQKIKIDLFGVTFEK